jgi:hypothetical protein
MRAAIRRTGRARRRGAVIFIVAMTLAVLASLGVYALRSAATEIRASGNTRQAMQTHYVAELGVTEAVQLLSGPRAGDVIARTRLGAAEMFGPVPLDGDYVVELTEPAPALPPPGYALGGPFSFRQVTVTSIGSTWPRGSEPSDGGIAGEGSETVRARVVTGPIATCTKPAQGGVTTVFIDPEGAGRPREVAVAIVAGGGGDVSPEGTAATCPRAPKATHAGPADRFPFRSKVRRWGADCAAGVPGRSVTVVRVDTGEVVAAFGRADSDPSRRDLPRSVLDAQPSRAIDTPLDSPMVGAPAVYPNEPGAIATKFFIGDADGTIWRFDIADPDPRKWRGEIFYDAYNADVDPRPEEARASGGAPIRDAPLLSLDPEGNLVLTFATGDAERAADLSFVASVSEAPTTAAGSSALRARVNWVQALGGPGGRPGERVTGPLALFDGVLYFATFAPPLEGVPGGLGEARLWGRDYRVPDPVCATPRACGGKRRLARPCKRAPCAPSPPPAFVVPGDDDSALAGLALSDVEVHSATACGRAGASRPAPEGTTEGYVLSASVDPKSGDPDLARSHYEQPIPAPRAAARILWWAPVVE